MKTPPHPSFGGLLRHARRAVGLTQEELAERAGVSVDAISLLERGLTHAPHLETVDLLAEALHLSAEERAQWEYSIRGLRLPDDETTNALDDADQPPVPTPTPSPTASQRTLPSGAVTFLFTNIEGSTKLLQRLGSEYARALGEHQALLRAAFAAHDGAEVDTQGDAFFVAFAAPSQALAAAADATRALTAHAWPEGATLRVRMGLHTGVPQVVGDHYVGLDVHRAARIAAAGHGGQILLSQTTCDLVEQNLPLGCTLRDLGAYLLKDLQQPERITQATLDGLPNDFPPLKSLNVRRHNLPIQPTPLLDRVEPTRQIIDVLQRDDVRLVTLTGAGGIGKTRLAIQVAAELLDTFADGVWFVRLSRLSDPVLVLSTIAQTFGVQETSGQPIATTLRAYLREKRLLLILDNFEQVMGAALDVAGLLADCPHLTVLVTSRIPLRLRGEHEVLLTPLPLPERQRPVSPEELSQYAALALFIERAQSARADFTVTAANAPAIAEICARLDGLPLAIELAAARVKLLPPPAILARLSSQLSLLTGGARDLEERQQTMRATIAWSEALLTPGERTLFRRLAVFVGGGALEAIEAVCVAPEGTEPQPADLLDGLSALVDQSLLQQREKNDKPRFGMLHIIREYALERLSASSEANALHQTHADYFLSLAERAHPELRGPEASSWFDTLEAEYDNLRAALGWFCEQGDVVKGLRLAEAIVRFWDASGRMREGLAWMERLLALAPGAVNTANGTEGAARAASAAPAEPQEVRARSLFIAGGLAFLLGDTRARNWLEEATTLGRAAGDLRTVARTLATLGVIAEQQRDLASAVMRYEESLALYRQRGYQRGIAIALGNLASAVYYQGDLAQAEVFFTEALALYRQADDRMGIALCFLNLGIVARRRGEVDWAESLGRDGLAIFHEQGHLRFCAGGLELLACTAGAAGDGERAARLLGAAAKLRETLNAPQLPLEQEDVEQAVAEARAALGEERWAAAYAAGRALSSEEAIAEALGSEREL